MITSVVYSFYSRNMASILGEIEWTIRKEIQMSLNLRISFNITKNQGNSDYSNKRFSESSDRIFFYSNT